MANFWSKKYFLSNKYWGWTKRTPEKCSFDYNLLKFWDFWGFLKFRDLVHNCRLFSWIFDTHVEPGSHIEMGNLEARTPCVLGSTSIDFLMCQSWNFEYCAIFVMMYTYVSLEKIFFFICQKQETIDLLNSLFLSFKLVLRSWKHNKCYIILKITNSNFSTLANQRMIYHGQRH